MIPSVINKTLLFQRYLSVLYSEKPLLPLPADQKQFSQIYGEILPESVDKLLTLFPLTKDDIFVDLGSGTGKIPLQVFLCSEVKESRGIELAVNLHDYAMQVAEQVANDLPDFYKNNRKLNFFCGNFLEFSLSDVTVVWFNSVCFTQDFLNQVSQIIDSNLSIHTVITLRPLCALKRLNFKKAVRIEGSWDSALCYVYKI